MLLWPCLLEKETSGRGVTANIPGLGPGDSGFESRRPDATEDAVNSSTQRVVGERCYTYEQMLTLGLNHNVRVFLLSDVLYWSASAVISTFLAVLVTVEITDGRLDAVGLVSAAFLAANALFGIPLSLLTRKLSRNQKKNLVSWTYIAYGVVIALFGFSTALWHILALQVAAAFLEALAYPLKWTIFSHILSKRYEETGWSLESFAASLMGAAAAYAAGVLSQKYGLTVIFVGFGLFYAASGVLFRYIQQKR